MQSLRKGIIFSDNIPRGIRIHEFNPLVKKGYAKMKSFSGATSKELLHYVDPSLQDGIYNTAIVHVGVSEPSNNKNTNKVDEWVSQKFGKYGNKMYFEWYNKSCGIWYCCK